MSNKQAPTKISKGAVKKSIRRTIDVPLPISENRRSILKHPTPAEVVCPSQASACPEIPNKYKIPELNTTLDLIKQIEKLKISKPTKITSMKCLTPQSKAIVTQEMTKKLNFHPDKQNYKGLIPINVNDSILIPEKRKPIRKKYVPRANRDLIPELSDFLTPIEPLKHTLPLYNKPDILRNPNNDNFQDIQELYVKFHPDL